MLARAFWPGPLTLVLPVASTCRISLLARAGLDTVAIRSPSHETARALIEAAGVPLAAPSANRSGAVSPTTAAHVVSELDGRVDWILDGGPCRHGLESTIVACLAGRPQLLRPGAITREAIESVLGSPIDVDERRGNRAERARAIGVALCAQDRASTRRGRAPRRTKPRSISEARSRAARMARGLIFRRPQILSRPRPVCSPICARWTPPAQRGSRSRRSRSMGLGRRSTIGSAARLLPRD